MISVITTIYNQLSMNQLFAEMLSRYTTESFELIVVDNASTDGSVKYFESIGAKIVQNDGNYSYPYCQNKGAELAQGEIILFVNNDIIFSPKWNEYVRNVMQQHRLDIASCCATDRMETEVQTRWQQWKWRWVREPLSQLGDEKWILNLMHRLMYRNWKNYSERRWKKFGDTVKEGIAGSNVIFTRRGWELMKPWDERINAGDFDLFLRTKEREKKIGDIKSQHLILGVYIHHFVRLTARRTYPPYVDRNRLIKIEEKWGKDYANELLKDTDMRI